MRDEPYCELGPHALVRPWTMTTWSGELDLAPSWGMFVGTGGATVRHSHLAHKLVVALAPGTSVVDGEPLAKDVWFVLSGQAHSVVARGLVLLLFFDAGTVGDLSLEASRPILVRGADDLRRASAGDRAAIAAAIAAELPGVGDVRVRSATSLLRSEPGLAIGDLAARLRLSSTRLTHLFSERLGISPRRYRSWGTLRRAVALLGEGKLLTEVAHEAGFSDSAHLSRAFSEMLGVTPSALSRGCVVRMRDR